MRERQWRRRMREPVKGGSPWRAARSWAHWASRRVDAAYFERVLLISLERTPERQTAFWGKWPGDWPYVAPQWVRAVDGHAGAREGLIPETWQGGSGAWGLWRTNLDILERAMVEMWEGPVLVLEDDCVLTPDAVARLPGLLETLERAAPHWEIFGLGVHHLRAPEPVHGAAGVVRCTSWDRTHALAIHPRFFESLYQFWSQWNTHIDHGLNRITQECEFYAASPVVAYQGANHSTIAGRREPSRSWDDAVQVWSRRAEDVPVVVLRCDGETLRLVWARQLAHTGYWTGEDDIDRGLEAIAGMAEAERPAAMREWLETLRWEAAAYDRAVVGVRHPGISLELVLGVCPEAVEVNGSPAEVLARLEAITGGAR